MDVDALKATFDEYQAFCEAKKDARFDRSEKTLEKLDDGPYYAISIYPGSCSTLGGPMKNEHGQVLDPAEEPHPASVRGGLLRQLPEPQLRHHRRQQRREPGVGPAFPPVTPRVSSLGTPSSILPSLIGSALRSPAAPDATQPPRPPLPRRAHLAGNRLPNCNTTDRRSA